MVRFESKNQSRLSQFSLEPTEKMIIKLLDEGHPRSEVARKIQKSNKFKSYEKSTVYKKVKQFRKQGLVEKKVDGNPAIYEAKAKIGDINSKLSCGARGNSESVWIEVHGSEIVFLVLNNLFGQLISNEEELVKLSYFRGKSGRGNVVTLNFSYDGWKFEVYKSVLLAHRKPLIEYPLEEAESIEKGRRRWRYESAKREVLKEAGDVLYRFLRKLELELDVTAEPSKDVVFRTPDNDDRGRDMWKQDLHYVLVDRIGNDVERFPLETDGDLLKFKSPHLYCDWSKRRGELEGDEEFARVVEAAYDALDDGGVPTRDWILEKFEEFKEDFSREFFEKYFEGDGGNSSSLGDFGDKEDNYGPEVV